MASKAAAAAVPASSGAARPLGTEDVVTANVVKLCNKMVPRVSEATLQYCFRILGSQLGAGSRGARSELEVLGKIRKMVDRQQSSSSSSRMRDQKNPPEQAQAERREQQRRLRLLEQAFQRVRGSPLVKQTWSIFHLLYALRNSSAATAGGGPFRAVVAPGGSSNDDGGGGDGPAVAEGEEARSILGTDSAFPSLEPGLKKGDAGSKREARQAALVAGGGFRIGEFSHELSEQLLLRDIMFALQGIDGEYIKYDTAVKGYVVDAGVGVPGSTRQLIRRVCEGGWLFRQVSTFLARCNASHTTGLVHQGMCQALQTEVTEYYRLIAVMKEQVNIDVSSLGEDDQPLSLRRLFIWMQDPIERLRLMAALAHGTGSLHGGALASAVHSHTRHGDPFVNKFITSQITALAQPLLDMTRQWIVEGVLNDPFLEFFVVADPAVTSDRLWQDKYSLNERMIPSFMTRATATKVLKIGKALNFLRQCCENSLWQGQAAPPGIFTFGQGESLKAFIDAQYDAVSRYLVKVIFDKYQLMDHMGALMRYLLLGQGEFVQCLMDLLQPELAKRSSQIYRHRLVTTLENAIRSTNAQCVGYDNPEVLKRLDVRMFEASPGDSGWEVFSLDYNVSNPLNVVITTAAMDKYLQVFALLFKIKRLEYVLVNTWKHHLTAFHSVKKLPGVPGVLHQCHLCQNQMVHFVTNLQHYIMFEVLQTSWMKLSQELPESADLDGVIRAHSEYLDGIVQNVLLDQDSTLVRSLLIRIFALIFKFCNIQERIYSIALAHSARIEQQRKVGKERTAAGKWGQAEGDLDMYGAKDVLDQLDVPLGEVKSIAADWSESLQFLAFRLDFNKYYESSNPEVLGSPTPVLNRAVPRQRQQPQPRSSGGGGGSGRVPVRRAGGSTAAAFDDDQETY